MGLEITSKLHQIQVTGAELQARKYLYASNVTYTDNFPLDWFRAT